MEKQKTDMRRNVWSESKIDMKVSNRAVECIDTGGFKVRFCNITARMN